MIAYIATLIDECPVAACVFVVGVFCLAVLSVSYLFYA